MNDHDPLAHSPNVETFQAVHRLLATLAPPRAVPPPDDVALPELVDGLERMLDLARQTADATVGPAFYWVGPERVDDPWTPVILQLDFDDYRDEDPPGVSRVGLWDDAAPARAGRAYRRECDWGFSPDESGIWLLSVVPYRTLGAGDSLRWSGALAGFVILQDRDMDGQYESLAHLWTAKEWRGRGTGTRLVRHALERFPVSEAEGPVTADGWRLLERCAPQLLGLPATAADPRTDPRPPS